MTPSERVRRLVASGSVAPEEGARLLAAMSEAPPRSPLSFFVDPFERFGGVTAVALGAIISAASVGVSRFGVRFDGLLDVHINRAVVPSLRVALLDQVAGWIVPALFFWAYARVLSKHVRLVDFVGMVGLARLPVLLCGLVVLPFAPEHPILPPKITPALLAQGMLGLVFVVANITLLYKGFKNASGLTGTKLVIGFSGMAIASEAASKIVLLCLS